MTDTLNELIKTILAQCLQDVCDDCGKEFVWAVGIAQPLCPYCHKAQYRTQEQIVELRIKQQEAA